MRIGISAFFSASGGSLTNLAQLLEVWSEDGTLARHELVLFASGATRDALRREAGSDVLARITMEIVEDAGSFVPRLIAEQIRILPALRRHRIDVLFCPGNVIPYLARIPTVAVFQNAAPFCDSVTFRTLRGQRWIQFRLLGVLVRATARFATRVIFISRFFRDLFVNDFGFPAERGAVITRASGVRHGFSRDLQLEASLGIRGPYVLSVSNINPYKNLVELIDAFARIRDVEGIAPRQLVMVGMINFPDYLERMKAAAAQGGVADRVVFTGELPHVQVEALLAGCESFVFTSTCENCPTALIEAMSAGLPIGSSNVGVMPEIGGDAVLYFDPYDPDSIAKVLLEMMTSEATRREMGARSAERAATFPTAEDVARLTLEVLEGVCA